MLYLLLYLLFQAVLELQGALLHLLQPAARLRVRVLLGAQLIGQLRLVASGIIIAGGDGALGHWGRRGGAVGRAGPLLLGRLAGRLDGR